MSKSRFIFINGLHLTGESADIILNTDNISSVCQAAPELDRITMFFAGNNRSSILEFKTMEHAQKYWNLFEEVMNPVGVPVSDEDANDE